MARMSDGGGAPTPKINIKKVVSNVAKKATQSANQTQRSNRQTVNRVRNVANAATQSARRTQRSNSYNSNRGSNRGNGYNSRSTSGGYTAPPRPSTGATSSGMVTSTSPPPPVTPKRLTDDQILAQDTTWLGQKASYKKALDDFMAQNTAERNKYTGQYDATKTGYDTQKGQDWQALQDDYASRGLSTSGLFADATSKFNNDWATKYADLDRAKTAYYGDLDSALSNFKGDQAEAQKLAQQQAVQRYLDKLKG